MRLSAYLRTKGKVKAVDLIRKNEQFRDMFVLLRQQWCVSDELLDAIQEFTCHNTKAKGVNEHTRPP